MGDKANCKAWGVKTLVFVFPLAVGLWAGCIYAGITGELNSEYMISATALFGAGFTVKIR